MLLLGCLFFVEVLPISIRLTVISIVEAVRARKGSVFIHTVSCSHWVSTHSNHLAELDWKLPRLRFFPTSLQLGPNNELIND